MQIVGLPCKNCTRPIGSILDGEYCGKCSLAFHHSCTDHSPICPNCGQSFAASRDTLAQRETQELYRQFTRGRRIALSVTVLLLLFAAASIVRPLVEEGRPKLSLADGGQSLSILIAVFFYLGYGWARTFLQISFLLSAVIGFVILSGALKTDDTQRAVTGLAVALFYGFLCGLITFSPSLSVFLACSRENRIPPS